MTDDLAPLRRRARQFAITVAGGALLAGIMVMVNRTDSDKPPHDDAPVPVSIARAAVQDVDIWKSGVGSIQALEVVDVKPRVDGQILRIFFHEGDEVAQGAPLAQIDPRPFKALYDQAIANRNRDAAQLANTHIDLTRATELAKLGAGTGQNADTLRAQAAAQAATVAADDALIRTAALNLEWTTIRSPIAGRVGLRQVNIGAIVSQSAATGIVTVTQIAPVAAIFSLPQDALPAITGANEASEVIVSGVEASAQVNAQVNRGSAHDLAHGRLISIDSQVDSSNGQVRVKASFANADRKLWPGTLISARLLAGVQRHVTTVPAAALQASQNGPFVYVLKPGNIVAARPVTAGETVDGTTIILSGLAAGDTVVTSGQSRIAIGSKVAPRQDRP